MKPYIILFFIIAAQTVSAQNTASGLKVISRISEYKASVKSDKNNRLVEIRTLIPDIQLDIRYATTNNFTGKAVYKQARAFGRLPVVKALQNVQKELRDQGLGLKIYDGYRPYDVTVKFFKLASDKNFVANPKDGSRHNRGCAIDLSLVDLKTGKDLPMPTEYDSFRPDAASGFKELPANVIENRNLLIRVMERNGFRVLDNEWWHFDFVGWKNFDLMNIPFESL